MKITLRNHKIILVTVAVMFLLSLNITRKVKAENLNLAQQYINKLNSDNIEVKIITAKKIPPSGITDPTLYDEVESQLLQYHAQNQLSEKEIDLMAWFCKDLASSGQKKYRSALNRIANNSNNAKLKHYAEQSLQSLGGCPRTIVFLAS